MTDSSETGDSPEPNTDLDSVGSIDFVVVEFPANESNFTGEMVEELLKLVDAGSIRAVDVLILVKDAEGVVDALKLSDVDNLRPLEALEVELAELLAEEDVAHLAAIEADENITQEGD